MPFDPGFLDLMSSIAKYLPITTRDLYGDPSFGNYILIPCHVTYTTKIVRQVHNEESVTTAQIIIPPPNYIWQPPVPDLSGFGYNVDPVAVPYVSTGDRFIISGPAGDHERKVLDVTLHTDEGTTSSPNSALNPNYISTVTSGLWTNISHQSISLT